jgi:6-phosphogluconolactonase (cycloisomerase 2 family)
MKKGILLKIADVRNMDERPVPATEVRFNRLTPPPKNIRFVQISDDFVIGIYKKKKTIHLYERDKKTGEFIHCKTERC